MEFELVRNDVKDIDHKLVLSVISVDPDITKEEILDLVKRDFISKINLIKLAYPNLSKDLITYGIIYKFGIEDSYIDDFDEYCLGCINFSSIDKNLFGRGEWPIFYVRIHKINDRLKDQDNILTYYISR